MIRLAKISEENYEELFKLKVSKEQEKFVSSPERSLAKAYVYYDRVTPFAVYNEDIMVGFVMVRFNPSHNNYFVWQLFIDEVHQGKGYGKKAMELVIKWIRDEKQCNEIVTTYIEGNHIARDLYAKLGFEQMGELLDGEVDMILNL